MKKIIYGLLFLSLILGGCADDSSNKSKGDAGSEQATEKDAESEQKTSSDVPQPTPEEIYATEKKIYTDVANPDISKYVLALSELGLKLSDLLDGFSNGSISQTDAYSSAKDLRLNAYDLQSDIRDSSESIYTLFSEPTSFAIESIYTSMGNVATMQMRSFSKFADMLENGEFGVKEVESLMTTVEVMAEESNKVTSDIDYITSKYAK